MEWNEICGVSGRTTKSKKKKKYKTCLNFKKNVIRKYKYFQIIEKLIHLLYK